MRDKPVLGAEREAEGVGRHSPTRIAAFGLAFARGPWLEFCFRLGLRAASWRHWRYARRYSRCFSVRERR